MSRRISLRNGAARKVAAGAVVAIAAFGLTACQDTADASGDAPASAGSNGGADSGSGGSDSGGGSGACKTSQLAFTSSGGMGNGTLIVNLKNTGSSTCTLQGFPGANLKSKDGTVSAARSKLTPPKTRVKPGDETHFTLHYTENTSGGTGVTFTRLVVTPPNETHHRSLPVSIKVAADAGSKPSITVDPVGISK